MPKLPWEVLDSGVELSAAHTAQPWLPEGRENLNIPPSIEGKSGYPTPAQRENLNPGWFCSLQFSPLCPWAPRHILWGVTPSLLSGDEFLSAQRSEVKLGRQRCRTCVHFQWTNPSSWACPALWGLLLFLTLLFKGRPGSTWAGPPPDLLKCAFLQCFCEAGIHNRKKKKSWRKICVWTPLIVFGAGWFWLSPSSVSPVGIEQHWIKPYQWCCVFYVVLIKTLTLICIKMGDSCSEPASGCPMHRGHSWMSGLGSSPPLRWDLKAAELGPKAASFGNLQPNLQPNMGLAIEKL